MQSYNLIIIYPNISYIFFTPHNYKNTTTYENSTDLTFGSSLFMQHDITPLDKYKNEMVEYIIIGFIAAALAAIAILIRRNQH